MNRNPYAAPAVKVADVQVATGDLAKFSKWVKQALQIELVVLIVALVSGYLEYRLLNDFQAGTFATDAAAEAAGATSDRRQMFVGIAQIATTLLSGVLTLMWIYRANLGARRQGASGMTFTPGWSVGWYFIPFANLFKPYQAMKEIWKASANPQDYSAAEVPALLPCWWTLWIVSNFLGNASFRLTLRADTLDSLLVANVVTLISDAIDIPLILLFFLIIHRVAAMQAATQREYEEESPD